MTDRVKRMLALLKSREYRKQRKTIEADEVLRQSAVVDFFSVTYEQRAAFANSILDAEQPLFHSDDDIFGFNFYRAEWPKDANIYVVGNWQGNRVMDYRALLEKGFGGIRAEAEKRYAAADELGRKFYDAVFVIFDACMRLKERYRRAAAESGRARLAKALERVPEYGATDYYEALLSVKFFQYVARIQAVCHVPLGRFDKYMKPYYEASVAKGASEEELLELTELFFISLNLDTDQYRGLIAGDNGQSLVLGGMDEDGNEVFSALSELVLDASEELKIIDPKINVRVNASTPLSLYERCTRLTKQGLGFPQYLNDDIIIPAMIDWGYDTEDARDYAVAACWEVIASGCGADTVNCDAINFPAVILNAVHNSLAKSATFDDFMRAVDGEIAASCDEIIARQNGKEIMPSMPFLSAFTRPCIERGRDVSEGGAKYNNYGVHGTGLSTAVDSLAAVEELVYKRKIVIAERLIEILDKNFQGYEDIRRMMLDCPKMGNNDPVADDKACFLLDSFARHLGHRPNNVGGIFRPGTGSAQGYIYLSREVGATPDGRYAFAPYACSYAPSLDARINGPLSAVQSFTKPNLKKVCNGGPFTIEIHDTVFRNDEGEKKVAMLVKSFIDLGGHQIQINTLNGDILRDAQIHPENYRNLIVRVWGWSGYFVELEKAFQDQIIRRNEFNFA